jgi:hypothetical protein
VLLTVRAAVELGMLEALNRSSDSERLRTSRLATAPRSHTLFDTLTGRLPETPGDSLTRLRHESSSIETL